MSGIERCGMNLKGRKFTGYAQQPGREIGAARSWYGVVLCSLSILEPQASDL